MCDNNNIKQCQVDRLVLILNTMIKKYATKSCKAKNDFFILLKLLNVIGLEQRETDNINQLIT
jgi:hypothetical protein